MQGTSINTMIGAEEQQNDQVQPEQMEAPPVRQAFEIPAFFKAPTGEGSVGDYVEHPLNFNGSLHMARILRGLTGMFGSLNKAIVDVVIGALGMMKDKRKAVESVANPIQP